MKIKMVLLTLCLLFTPLSFASDRKAYITCLNKVLNELGTALADMSCSDVTGSMKISLSFTACSDVYAGDDEQLRLEIIPKAAQAAADIANNRRHQCESGIFIEQDFVPVEN